MIITDEMKNFFDNELWDIHFDHPRWDKHRDHVIKRIIELHEANKPKLEPYCYMSKTSEGEFFPTQNQITENDIPIYTTLPTQEPLRNEQINLMAHNDDEGDWNDLNYKKCWYKGYKEGFRRAEEAHGIGTTND